MPMCEGSVPSNLSFKNGCDKSCLKNMDTLQQAHTKEKTLHMWIQFTTDSHTRDKYMTDTCNPCGTVRSGLSRMGQVHHRHTQRMWYSPQRTLTHGTSTSQAHSPCGTVRSELSRMGQAHHRHTQPMWYSPQRTLMHGTSISQTHTAHVVQPAANSRAWNKYITDTHGPCGTVCSGLSRMGQVHHRHTQPMWYSLQRTLTHGTSTSQTYSLCGNKYTTLIFIITDKYY